MAANRFKIIEEGIEKIADNISPKSADDPTWDLWDLDVTLAKLILPRLAEFAKKTNGMPSRMTFKKWKSILRKMIWSFDAIANDNYLWKAKTAKKREKKIQEGLTLFGKYFTHLWL